MVRGERAIQPGQVEGSNEAEVGIGGHTFHGLRHTYASQLAQTGTPLPVIAEQLGHANTTTVSRTYGHLAPQIREAEVRQRFASLCPESASAAEIGADYLADLRTRLHGSNWRGYAQIADTSSWPRSNFYRGDAELVRLCRGEEEPQLPIPRVD